MPDDHHERIKTNHYHFTIHFTLSKKYTCLDVKKKILTEESDTVIQ